MPSTTQLANQQHLAPLKHPHLSAQLHPHQHGTGAWRADRLVLAGGKTSTTTAAAYDEDGGLRGGDAGGMIKAYNLGMLLGT
jgi:hypothetical protein